MSDEGKCYAATPAATLEEHILNSNIAKSDTEWWAHHEITRLRAELAAANTRMSKLDFERTAAELERDAIRDALLARLAPVDDKELVEIAADAISTYVPDQVSKWGSIKDAAIDAIAAIRPHIEAAERERLREDIKSRFAPKSAQQIRDETDRLIEKHRQSVSDWLEAGSWKQSGAGNEPDY